MAEPAVLFIRSEKVEKVAYTQAVPGHPCTAGYRAVGTDFVVVEEDKKAIEALEKKGLSFTIVDLGSASTTARLSARIEGVKITPTLFYEGQKLEGLKQIMSTLDAMADTQQK